MFIKDEQYLNKFVLLSEPILNYAVSKSIGLEINPFKYFISHLFGKKAEYLLSMSLINDLLKISFDSGLLFIFLFKCLEIDIINFYLKNIGFLILQNSKELLLVFSKAFFKELGKLFARFIVYLTFLIINSVKYILLGLKEYLINGLINLSGR